MFVNFFIDRPIFASVMAIVITLVGALSIVALPVAQYPEISPPTVQVSTSYTGASAQVVEESVAAPIEEQVNGAEGMMYMNSISANDGSYVLTVSFEVDRDLDMATVDVQNRVALAQPKLPSDVVQSGISVKKQSPNMLGALTLVSPDKKYDGVFMSNYAKINISDALSRIPGVGNVTVFGSQDYSIRVWLDPDKLAKFNLTTEDVSNAVREQNVQAPAGQIGQPPAQEGQEFQYTIKVKGRLTDVEEFENIIVHSKPDGSFVRLKDVADVEMGSEAYNSFMRLDNGENAGILLYQLPGANAMNVMKEIKKTMKELSANFPDGMEYIIPFDTTKFVTASIEEVLHTLVEAMVLVFLVVFIFLQNWRATLIPMITVPVSLIGTFACFEAFGFSINTLTMFGLVLAIGIVVDDAIVVVEAVQHNIDEKGMKPKEATKAAMSEVSGAIIAVTMVLIAVFVPVAFMGGITGRLYQQFALTLAVSVGLSAFNALTLSPALCAIMLKPEKSTRGPLGWFFGKFNKYFNKITNGYQSWVRLLIRRSAITLMFLLGFFGLSYLLLDTLPTAFVPLEDQGYFIVSVQLPEAASLERNNEVVEQIEDYLNKADGIDHVLTLGGMNIMTSAMSSYTSTLFVILDDWSDRTSPELSLDAILGNAQQYFWGIQDAIIMGINPPPISGLGTTGGFQFEFQDRSGGDVSTLAQAAENIIIEANKRPEVNNLFTPFSDNVPQIQLELDRDKVKTLGVQISAVFNALQTYMGGLYVNDFNKFGRTYRVMLQADSKYRAKPQDINNIYVRNDEGGMVPLGTLVTIKEIYGPEYIRRYNVYRTVEISGGTPKGYSSGQSIKAMEEVAAANMPQGYGFDWTGTAFQEKSSGSQSVYIFALALVMVFLFLAAQYESWSVPFAVIFAVPLGIFGAMGAQWLRGLNNDVYAQIGLVMLVGLVAKNAILIVEFAKMRHEQGFSIVDAALEAAHLRFRPILMTSFAFILGVVPLVVASGAGSASRHALGTSVFGGMLAGTCLGVMFVPVLYAVIGGKSDKSKKKDSIKDAPPPAD